MPFGRRMIPDLTASDRKYLSASGAGNGGVSRVCFHSGVSTFWRLPTHNSRNLAIGAVHNVSEKAVA
eukprot:4309293-Pleurochrysis_carterae.AAC.2